MALVSKDAALRAGPGGRTDDGDLELNMTPMIDIVFQLIVFFMLQLKFKEIDRQIDSNLPRDRGPVASNFVTPPLSIEVHAARLELCARHQRRIVSERGLVSANVSALIEERDVALVMLPIYIGSFRFRDRPWRFLINAQSGTVVGEAPVDRKKVALVVLVGLLVAGLALWWFGAQP